MNKHLITKCITIFTLVLTTACSSKEKMQLTTEKVEAGELSETVTATGTVESVTQVDVGTQVTGIIDKLYADYNSVVKKGELLAEIEKTLLESDLKSAEANVESARLTYEYNLTNYKRDKALHDKQLISDYEFQTSSKELEVSKTALDKAKADRVRAAKNLNYAEIYSPIDGIVISREVEVGQTVVASMNVANIFTIADLDHMQIIGDVDEADIGQVKVGQKVTFSVDAYPEEQFTGTVTQVRLSATTTNNVVTYEVVVSAENPDHKLIPGLTANLTIYTMEQSGVLLVSNRAFTFEPETGEAESKLPQPKGSASDLKPSANQKVIWVVEEKSLVPKLVTVGDTNGMKTVITSGLKSGEKVALGYTTEVAATKEDTAKSPFAPTPPGRKNKK